MMEASGHCPLFSIRKGTFTPIWDGVWDVVRCFGCRRRRRRCSIGSSTVWVGAINSMHHKYSVPLHREATYIVKTMC
jgi:hypothetical protein